MFSPDQITNRRNRDAIVPMQNRPHHDQYIGAYAGRWWSLSFKTVRDHAEFLQSSIDDGETSERQTDTHSVSITNDGVAKTRLNLINAQSLIILLFLSVKPQ